MNKQEKFIQEVRLYLRANAKQVKMVEFDFVFTGSEDPTKSALVTHERKDLGPKGYKAIKREFKNFEELKLFYKVKKIKNVKFKTTKRVKESDEQPRERSESGIKRFAKKVAKHLSKKR